MPNAPKWLADLLGMERGPWPATDLPWQGGERPAPVVAPVAASAPVPAAAPVNQAPPWLPQTQSELNQRFGRPDPPPPPSLTRPVPGAPAPVTAPPAAGQWPAEGEWFATETPAAEPEPVAQGPLGIPQEAPAPVAANGGGWTPLNMGRAVEAGSAEGGLGGGAAPGAGVLSESVMKEVTSKKNVSMGKKIMKAFDGFLTLAMGKGAKDMPMKEKGFLALMSILQGANTAMEVHRTGRSSGPGMLPALRGLTAQRQAQNERDDYKAQIQAAVDSGELNAYEAIQAQAGMIPGITGPRRDPIEVASAQSALRNAEREEERQFALDNPGHKLDWEWKGNKKRRVRVNKHTGEKTPIEGADWVNRWKNASTSGGLTQYSSDNAETIMARTAEYLSMGPTERDRWARQNPGEFEKIKSKHAKESPEEYRERLRTIRGDSMPEDKEGAAGGNPLSGMSREEIDGWATKFKDNFNRDPRDLDEFKFWVSRQ